MKKPNLNMAIERKIKSNEPRQTRHQSQYKTAKNES
ncbi:hypothetical protein PSEUDO8O_150431 [Pseudomonas sp. 8O]|nr:hypothetical protein PSEUDO8O_150431 [Pseudomonas sp. 8O]